MAGFIKRCGFLFIISACLITGTPVVDAHDLEKDGSISALLHIAPYDDPSVGESALFVFDFKNTIGDPNADNCDCRFEIYQDINPLYGVDVPKKSLHEGLPYTFDKEGIYRADVKGHAKDGTFEDFDIKYQFEVSSKGTERTKLHLPHSEHYLHGLLFGGGFLTCAFLIYKEQKRINKKKKKSS